MTPEMCADEYIRFTTIMRSLDTTDLKFIICGANGHDLDSTRRLMKEWADRRRHETPTWGISLHYYTDAFGPFGESRVYHQDEEDWYDELFRANYMARIIDDHRAALDEADPERKIKLVIHASGEIGVRAGPGPARVYSLFEQQIEHERRHRRGHDPEYFQ